MAPRRFPRILAIDNMRARPPEAIVGALTDGAMREQGAELGPAERRAIAEFITGRRVAAAAGGSARSGGRRVCRRRRLRLGHHDKSGRGSTAARNGTAGELR